MTAAFQEFPKMMVHPAHEPAVLSTIFPLGYKPRPGEVENPGKPERYPAVTVQDDDQQAYYEAKGYHVQGSDAAAFAVAAAGGIPAHYKYAEYPKMIQVVTADGEKVDMLVHSADEEHQMLGYNAPAEASTTPAVAKPKNKGGRPKGSVKKPITDHMKVTD